MAMILFFIGDLLTLQVQLLMLNILLIACLFCFLKLDMDIRFTDRFKKIENEEITNENFEEPGTIEVEFDSENTGGLKIFRNDFFNQFTAVMTFFGVWALAANPFAATRFVRTPQIKAICSNGRCK